MAAEMRSAPQDEKRTDCRGSGARRSRAGARPWGLGLLLAGLLGLSAQAAEVQVAVAANFNAPMRRIAEAFERDTGHRAVLTFGSTGALAAQIRNGAPWEVLLAADAQTPARLAADGFAVPGSPFTYAFGRLVLWSPQAGVVDEQGALLKSPRLQRLALADPKLAPYGAAAVQVMQHLGLLQALQPKWVVGQSIAQAHQFVASGNATAGFVAWSQVQDAGRLSGGSAWLVPATLHEPIRQDAVLLLRGRDKPAAVALMAYLRSEPARALIAQAGYRL